MNRLLKATLLGLGATGAVALSIDGFKSRAPASDRMVVQAVPAAKLARRPIVTRDGDDGCALDLKNSGGTLKKQGEALDQCGALLPTRSANQPIFDNAFTL